ncbi:MAG: PhzF family phenazine biosynthesis protein [Candidatus Riflebacteria bacterium]|nr:PhzF family phenazine biosynthesis protein [Candidatus Riflebacteria bacterium]
MKIPYYQIDVFTNDLFKGNPAGVCILPSGWLSDELMKKIAFENNLSETAFVTRQEGSFYLRWFTPTAEMDLCGHATVAPAHVFFEEIGFDSRLIKFETRSGTVRVENKDKFLVLDFPSRPPIKCEEPQGIQDVLGKMPLEVLKARDLMFVFDEEEDVRNMKPDFRGVLNWGCHGVIVTAPGKDADFVSRFFAPVVGVNEDPVTGSAHSTLIPYWSKRLNKTDLYAKQISARGGELFCQYMGDRVKIGGKAITYLRGEIDVLDQSNK